LHDGCRVTVLVFFEAVELSNGVVECLLGEVAGFLRWIKDFIVEDWVVKG
jgi:hypothetical protein